MLDLRLAVNPKPAVTGDCGWLILLDDSWRLDLRDMSDGALTIDSGARISTDPRDTSRVCRLGDGLLRDDFLEIGNTSSFNGDGGLCTGLPAA